MSHYDVKISPEKCILSFLISRKHCYPCGFAGDVPEKCKHSSNVTDFYSISFEQNSFF